jgi:hypothetical protein
MQHAQWSRLELDNVIAHRWIEDELEGKLVWDAEQDWDKVIVYQYATKL